MGSFFGGFFPTDMGNHMVSNHGIIKWKAKPEHMDLM